MERIAVPTLARQTHDALLRAIRRGEFPNGKLPPENGLAAELGVSRTTVRAALQRLEHDGLLSRRRGIGTRIVMLDGGRFQLDLTRLASLEDLLRDRGYESSTEIVDVRRDVLPALSKELGLPPESEWHVVEKIWHADGYPAALLRDHIPLAILPKLPPNVDLLGTIFRLFAEAGPEPIAVARVELVPMVADAATAKQLQIAPRSAHLRLWQRHYSASERLLAISRLDVNDRFVRFEMLRTI
jgi:GntR family transcriptional regulator